MTYLCPVRPTFGPSSLLLKINHRDPRPRLCRGRPRACLRRALAAGWPGVSTSAVELDQLSGRYLIYSSLRALAAGSRVTDT